MRRREFITMLGGTAISWPLVARAQQPERMRHIGVLMNYPSDDPEAQIRVGAFLQGLQEHGWSVGRNVRIEYRYGALDPDRLRNLAADLVAWSPDVIVANAPASVIALQDASRKIPIVFAAVTDPVGLGIVQTLAKPGGNATGFTPAEYSMSAKWLELLKELSSNITRVAILRDPSNPSAMPQFAAIQTAAAAIGVDVVPIGVRTREDIEQALADFARLQNRGVIVTRLTETIARSNQIIQLVAQYRLPAVYPLRLFASGGGLAAYGPNIAEDFRRMAGYVHRILKTAKALGLEIPPTLLARADEVIE